MLPPCPAVDGTEVCACYYAYEMHPVNPGDPPLARRCYWLLCPDEHKGQSDLVLVHYLVDSEEATTASADAAEVSPMHKAALARFEVAARARAEVRQTGTVEAAAAPAPPAQAAEPAAARPQARKASVPCPGCYALGLRLCCLCLCCCCRAEKCLLCCFANQGRQLYPASTAQAGPLQPIRRATRCVPVGHAAVRFQQTYSSPLSHSPFLSAGPSGSQPLPGPSSIEHPAALHCAQPLPGASG